MLETFIILCFTTLACSSLGNLLVLKNESMLADALSHAILLGIVLGFFVSRDLHSPLLIIGATLFGVLTILFIDLLMKSDKINHDAATGLVFPFLFAIAVILISMFAKNVHLDIDMVLMGEILLTSFTRIHFLGISLPLMFIQTGVILLINILFLISNYNKLKLYLFDIVQAHLAGMHTILYKIIIMLLVALTTVVSFNSVGSITVICFFVAPSMSALHFCKNFKQLLIISSIFSIINSTIGFSIALLLNLNIAGSATFISLVTFIICILIQQYKPLHNN